MTNYTNHTSKNDLFVQYIFRCITWRCKHKIFNPDCIHRTYAWKMVVLLTRQCNFFWALPFWALPLMSPFLSLEPETNVYFALSLLFFTQLPSRCKSLHRKGRSASESPNFSSAKVRVILNTAWYKMPPHVTIDSSVPVWLEIIL